MFLFHYFQFLESSLLCFFSLDQQFCSIWGACSEVFLYAVQSEEMQEEWMEPMYHQSMSRIFTLMKRMITFHHCHLHKPSTCWIMEGLCPQQQQCSSIHRRSSSSSGSRRPFTGLQEFVPVLIICLFVCPCSCATVVFLLIHSSLVHKSWFGFSFCFCWFVLHENNVGEGRLFGVLVPVCALWKECRNAGGQAMAKTLYRACSALGHSIWCLLCSFQYSNWSPCCLCSLLCLQIPPRSSQQI